MECLIIDVVSHIYPLKVLILFEIELWSTASTLVLRGLLIFLGNLEIDFLGPMKWKRLLRSYLTC